MILELTVFAQRPAVQDVCYLDMDPRLMDDASNRTLPAVTRRLAECFKYRAFAEGDSVASNADAGAIEDAYFNYYHAMNLFELGRRQEGLERLRRAAQKLPDEIVSVAAGHYLSRRLRTSEGYGHEDGWITMLEVALESGLLPLQASGVVELEGGTHTPQTESLIPRQIVQFWDVEPPPEEVQHLIQSTKDKNNGLLHHVYCSEAARSFVIASLGSNAGRLFDACPHAASQADFFRAVYLYDLGGVYIDADEFCEKPLDDWLFRLNLNLLLTYTRASTSCINNWFIAAAPKTILLKRIVEYIVGNLEFAANNGPDTGIWVLTGPGVWTFGVLDIALDPFAYSSGSPYQNAVFLEELQYRRLFRNVMLNYKKTAKGNWRL